MSEREGFGIVRVEMRLLWQKKWLLLGVFCVTFALVYGWRSLGGAGDCVFSVDVPGPEGKLIKVCLPEGPKVSSSSVEQLALINKEYVFLVSSVVRSVVSLDTVGATSTFQGGTQSLGVNGGASSNSNIFSGGSAAKSLGSGVIVSKQGHIITNNHVIEGKRAIRVTLWDGRIFEAIKVGEDKILDLAVLKIEAGEALDALSFGNSDQVEVGEIVFAVGNPYGLGETVTRGIISAKQRNLGDLQGEFLQTDAAINPGNSGGPLINIRGEIIGINSAIYSTKNAKDTGRSQGLGFSIPSNSVRDVFLQIMQYGKPLRGYMGVDLIDPTPQVRSLLRYDKDYGVAVDTLHPGSPADKAGIKPGDVILAFNGESVVSARDLLKKIHSSEIGKNSVLHFWRRGQEGEAQVPIIEAGSPLPEEATQLPHGLGRLEKLGMRVRNLTLQEYALGARGVMITSLIPQSEASRLFRMGDLIRSSDTAEIADVQDLEKALQGGAATLFITRGYYHLMVRVVLPEKE